MNPTALHALHLAKITQPRTSFLTRLEAFAARWLFRRLMRKDWSHRCLAEVMMEMAVAARDAFPEDNDPTLATFLEESLRDGIGKALPHAKAFS